MLILPFISMISNIFWTQFYTSWNLQKTEAFFTFAGGIGMLLQNVSKQWNLWEHSQLTFTCWKATMETVEKGANNVQS